MCKKWPVTSRAPPREIVPFHFHCYKAILNMKFKKDFMLLVVAHASATPKHLT